MSHNPDVDALSGEDSAGEMTWPKPSFDERFVINKLRQQPFIRKKRVYSASFSHSGANGLTFDGIPSDVRSLTAALHRSHLGTTRSLHGKNSRKSRDGRRVPHKRGGKSLEDPTDILDEIELDHGDPDYDSDAQDPVVLESLVPSLSDEEFTHAFTNVMKELFIHGDIKESVAAISDLNPSQLQRRRLPYMAVAIALQHKQTQCELTSELLSDLCGKVIDPAHVQHGFLLVLNELDELTIDFPKASERVGRFIARAVMDDILPPKFIDHQKSVLGPQTSSASNFGDCQSGSPPSPLISTPTGCSRSVFEDHSTVLRHNARNLSDSSNGISTEKPAETSASSGIGSVSSLGTSVLSRSEIAMAALLKAEHLITLSRSFARLDNIWGKPAGPRAAQLLVKKVNGLLRSYMETGDMDEATDALLELDSPHFHHELVFQAVIMAIELSTEDAHKRVIELLKEFCRSVVITTNQLNLGIRRVFAELPDLQLDVPAAYLLMERFVTAANEAGFVTDKLAREMPSKPRKRFISETTSFCKSQKDTSVWNYSP